MIHSNVVRRILNVPCFNNFLNCVLSIDEGKKLFNKAKKNQKLSVLKWNPHIDEPTKSIYLGLVGIDESAAKECGAILLDLLLRCGVLVQTTNGEWILADNWEARWRQEHEAPSQRDERRR